MSRSQATLAANRLTGLRRFWFTFRDPPQFSPLGLGCGVTAQNYEDATSILTSTVFAGGAMPPVESVAADVDVQTLDRDHVLPNMGSVSTRGVWFPLGYGSGS